MFRCTLLKGKSVLQNEILGKLVLGKIVPIILQFMRNLGMLFSPVFCFVLKHIKDDE